MVKQQYHFDSIILRCFSASSTPKPLTVTLWNPPPQKNLKGQESSRYKPKGFQLQSISVWRDGREGWWLPLLLEAMVANSLTDEQFLWSSLCQYKTTSGPFSWPENTMCNMHRLWCAWDVNIPSNSMVYPYLFDTLCEIKRTGNTTRPNRRLTVFFFTYALSDNKQANMRQEHI